MPDTAPSAPSSSSLGYKYYDLVVAAFVAVLLCSNLIGPGKTVSVVLPWLTVRFGAGNLFFPVSYIFGDILTEVYGYARSRRAIWAGTGAMVFATVMALAVLRLPADQSAAHNRVLQPALVVVFGNTWRIAAGSLLAFWMGDFVNSFVLAKLKLMTRGRHLWARTIGSTVAGQLVDSLVFYPIAFAGIWPTETLLSATVFNWLFKVTVEVGFTPLTYIVVNTFKRAERQDYFDVDTNFTPFSLKDPRHHR